MNKNRVKLSVRVRFRHPEDIPRTEANPLTRLNVDGPVETTDIFQIRTILPDGRVELEPTWSTTAGSMTARWWPDRFLTVDPAVLVERVEGDRREDLEAP